VKVTVRTVENHNDKKNFEVFIDSKSQANQNAEQL